VRVTVNVYSNLETKAATIKRNEEELRKPRSTKKLRQHLLSSLVTLVLENRNIFGFTELAIILNSFSIIHKPRLDGQFPVTEEVP
jgi:hypothetical protein